MNKKQKILVVAAHPDDEILGCGGAIVRHTLNGDEVHIIIMAEGITSRDSARNIDFRNDELETLHKRTRQASEIMGVKSVKLYNFPDNRMDSIDLLDIIKMIETTINKIKPDVVYTHHAGDVNIDHKITHDAVITACRPLPKQSVKRILFFETLSSTEWQMETADKTFLPNWFINIEEYYEIKMNALKCYDSEMREYPHPRSYEGVEILSKYRGAIVGCKYAEAFMLGRNII